jgi:hypothetical protein
MWPSLSTATLPLPGPYLMSRKSGAINAHVICINHYTTQKTHMSRSWFCHDTKIVFGIWSVNCLFCALHHSNSNIGLDQSTKTCTMAKNVRLNMLCCVTTTCCPSTAVLSIKSFTLCKLTCSSQFFFCRTFCFKY